MAGELTRAKLRALMQELARTAPPGAAYRVYLLGGATAVHAGWRRSSIDADLFCEEEQVFHDIQGIKTRLGVNVDFARPEQFVPALEGSADRHVLVETIGSITFWHYDPYAQILWKIVRGFRRDVEDAGHFLRTGMVDPDRLRSLVERIPEAAYAKHPSLTRDAVVEAVRDFLAGRR